MNATSQIEVLNRRKAELSKHILSLKNDPDFWDSDIGKKILKLEKDIENIKQKHATEKAAAIERSMFQIDALEKAILNSKFQERINVVGDVFAFLHKNPKTKIEDLKDRAAEFTLNPEIQKMWSNILLDVQLGPAVHKELSNPEFDITDSKTWSVKSVGQKIEKFAKENPTVVAATVIGLGIASVIMLFDESKIKKAIGGAAGIVGCILGFKLWGRDLGEAAKKGLDKIGIGPGVRNDAEKYAKEAGAASKGLLDKITKRGKPGNREAMNQEMDDFDKHTENFAEKIKERSLEGEMLYRALRAQLKSNDPTVNKSELERDCMILESSGTLENKYNYYWNRLFNNTVVTIGEVGLHLMTAGGYFIYKIAKEDIQFYKNFTRWIFNRSVDNYADLTQHYALNAVFVGGVASAWEYVSLARTGGKTAHLLPAVLKGLKVGVAWPVYSVQMGGRGISKFATKMAEPKLLGRWQKVGKSLEFIDKTGQRLAKFGPKGAIKLLGKGGGVIIDKFKGGAGGKASEKAATAAAKGVEKRAAVQAAKKLGMKSALPALVKIGGKIFFAAEAIDIGTDLIKKTEVGNTVISRADTLLLGGNVIDRCGKAGYILMEEITRRRRRFQAIGSHDAYGLGNESDFDFNPFVGSMRQEGTLLEAAAVTNQRIEKELGKDVPLFDLRQFEPTPQDSLNQ